jgi:hypothetical protein
MQNKTYERKHLKEDIEFIADLQRRGEILVAAYAPEYSTCWPFPYLHDVPGLRREYPKYSCAWGDFSPVGRSGLGVYAFQPNERGKQELPPGWSEYALDAPIQPATAVVDPARRWAKVVTEDGGTIATLTDVAFWDSGSLLLDDFRRLLAKQRVPVIVWRVEWQESDERPLWNGPTPQIRNDHAAVSLAGCAYDDDGNLVYLSAVGHKTALEAIRASLMGRHRKGRLYLSTSSSSVSLNGLDRYEQVWTPLPDFAAHHAVFVARMALKPEPMDSVAYLLVFDDDEAQAKRLLIQRLHEALPIPFLDGWADALWNAAQERRWVARFYAGGDCRGVWRVSLQAEWAELVEALITQGTIEITI